MADDDQTTPDAAPDQVSGHTPEIPLARRTSSVTVNWLGFLALVPIAIGAAFAWRWLGDQNVPTGTGTPAAATTTIDAAPVTTSTTTPPTTTTTSPRRATVPLPATTVASDRRVIIRGEMKPCRFGANCLAASFEIEGFDPHPGDFTCIYPNSSTQFGFNDNDVEDACLTADAGDTITIEVDGVMSATISEQNLDGT